MERETSSWAIGWAYFAAFMLIIAGVFQAVVGLAAVIDDDFYVVAESYAFSFDLSGWGWLHVGMGLALVLVGVGIAVGNTAARIVGVVLAGLSAVNNFAFLPYYPIWSVAVIAVDVAVIWALTAHGRDVEAALRS
jgi:hypothetical protein